MLNRAAREAGIAYSTVWRHRKQNAEFDEAVSDAINEALDRAEGKIWDLLDDPNTPDSVALKAAIYILRKCRPEMYGTPIKAEPPRVIYVPRL